MAGIIGQEMKGEITPQSIEAQLHLQGPQKEQLQRIVAAGLKVMFDKSTHQMLLDQLQGEGDTVTKMGEGVAGLMGILMKESQNSLPPQLIIPAGMVLVAHAADYLEQTGEQVGNEQVAAAIDHMIRKLLSAAGVDPERVMAEGERGLGAAAQEQPALEPAAPAEEGLA